MSDYSKDFRPDKAPLVSVVTIFFNGEKYLQEAIESVLAQSYPRWELLLIDDGSTDGSVEIAKRYAAQDAGRIHYFQHPGHRNRGKNISRNLGLRRAGGEFVTFLDGDDVFEPGKLGHQSRLLLEHPVAMVYGATLYWRDWGNCPVKRRNYVGRLGVPLDQVYEPPELLKMFLKQGGTVPCICGLMARTAVAREVGGFDERIEHLFEDQVFIAKICAQYPVFVESGVWEKYRQHEESSSHQAILKGDYHPTRPNPSQRAYLEWLKEYLGEEGIRDPQLDAAWAAAMWRYRHPVLDRVQRTVRQYLRLK